VKRLVAATAVIAALAVPATARAHPLGNFTINSSSRIEVSGNRLYVAYALDLAEIPTFQARAAGGLDSRALARRITANLRLTVDGRAAVLRPLRTTLAFPEGAGGLRTTRFQVLLSGPVLDRRSLVVYRDNNYSTRTGWREVSVRATSGAEVVSSSAPRTSPSRELRAYPKGLLQSPVHVTSARAILTPGRATAAVPALARSGAAPAAGDRTADHGFASLIERGRLSALVVLASLGIAFFWGLVHALSPGHGKAIITAYLVGQRGTPRHAAYLGLIVTVTHTIGVFGLGLVTLLLSEFIVPDTLYPWLNLASGLLVVGIGASVLYGRLRRGAGHRFAHALGREHDHHHGDAHSHGHHHGHDHDHGPQGHSHVPTVPGWRGLVAVGASAGLLPCPSALVVLLGAISLHRVAFGLVLILAFSLGLALTITSIGLVAVLAKRIFTRLSFEGSLVRLLPAASALAILVVGVAMTVHALPKVS
jgi:ABC-type nickel/cobalt efflux system permease component RcnA